MSAAWHKMTADQLLRCGFAAAVLPDKAVDSTKRHGHIQAVHSVEGTEGLFESLNFNGVHDASLLFFI